MDLRHLKNSELEPQFHKYKGRVVLRGDIVKDDSGSYAVFTEQGSSASQMKDLALRNFDARHGKIETGAVVKNREGLLLPVERKRPPMYEGKPVQFPA